MDGQTKGMLAVCEARAELVTSVLPNEKRRKGEVLISIQKANNQSPMELATAEARQLQHQAMADEARMQIEDVKLV